MAPGTRPQQSRSTGRSQTDSSMTDGMDSDDDQSTARTQQTRRGQQTGQQTRGGGRSQGRELQAQDDQQTPDLLSAVTPAFQEARRYIEGSPVRAAAVGAIAGGLLMTLFSTEKGRSFVKMAYDYANPMVAKYAREYIAEAAGNMTDQALKQH